jgi:probable F420-dependent oxidoreductase
MGDPIDPAGESDRDRVALTVGMTDAAVKIRFGVSPGADTPAESLPDLVDQIESLGIDSLWFSELVYAEAVDPVVGMAFALGRTRNLKVGTSVAVLPGRHPVLVAKQLASLAALAPKRVLPVFGLRSALPAEREFFPVRDGRRAEVFDESLRLLRASLTGDAAPFSGEFFTVAAPAVAPKIARPLDIWLGGSAPAAFRRIGRLADGWLGSFLTPAEAGRGVRAIEAAAAEAGRAIEPDHYGINIAVSDHGLPETLVAAVRARRPDVDPSELVADGWDALHRLLDGYLEAGLSKFVIRPAFGADIAAFADRFAAELLPRQN